MRRVNVYGYSTAVLDASKPSGDANNGATATWSGYNHQGKVGLFVALREMANLVVDAGSNDGAIFVEWYVEFEGPEDFDICAEPPNDNAEYLHSRHQVKAFAGNAGRYFSDYKEVTAPYTNRNGNQMPGFNKSIVGEHGQVIADVEVPPDKRFVHIIQHVPSWKDDITSNPNQVSLYEYPALSSTPAQKYCGLSNSSNNASSESDIDCPLDEAAYEQLGKIIPKRRSELKLIWMALQVELQKRISMCHDDPSKPRPKIRFRELLDSFIVNNKALDSYRLEYELDTVRRGLINAWQNVLSAYGDGVGIDEASRLRIEHWLSDVHKKQNNDLKSYIKSFSPDMCEPLEGIQMDGFHAVICEVMRQVETTPNTSSHQYKKHDLPYYLTTIARDPSLYPNPTLAKAIHNAIDSSSDNRYKLACNIVTSRHDFDLDGPSITDLLEYDVHSEGLENSDIAGVKVPNVEAYRPRRVISVETAVKQLNEEA